MPPHPVVQDQPPAVRRGRASTSSHIAPVLYLHPASHCGHFTLPVQEFSRRRRPTRGAKPGVQGGPVRGPRTGGAKDRERGSVCAGGAAADGPRTRNGGRGMPRDRVQRERGTEPVAGQVAGQRSVRRVGRSCRRGKGKQAVAMRDMGRWAAGWDGCSEGSRGGRGSSRLAVVTASRLHHLCA